MYIFTRLINCYGYFLNKLNAQVLGDLAILLMHTQKLLKKVSSNICAIKKLLIDEIKKHIVVCYWKKKFVNVFLSKQNV